MNRGDAVRAVRAHDGEIRHANVPCRAFLDQARAGHPPAVTGEAAPHVIEQASIDLEHELEVPRQQRLEPGERPFLERLGQQRVIGVRERPPREVPRLIPAEVRLVEQDPEQLGDGNRRVRIVELDGRPLGEQAPLRVAAAESPDEIGQRAGDEKVLLHEPQLLATRRRVVGIEDPRQRLRGQRPGQRADELAVAECLEIEEIRGGRRPQAQRVDRLAAVTDDGSIVRDTDQRRWPPGNWRQRSSSKLDGAVQLHFDLVVRTDDLPGIGAAEPVIGLLVLPTVLDGLSEHPVLVPEPIPDGRQLHRCHRVEEARGETSEAAIAEPGVGLLFEQPDPVERVPLDHVVHDRTEQEVRDVVGQRASDQKLHREVIDALGIRAIVGLLCAHPALRQDVANRAGEGLVTLARGGRRRIGHVVEEQVPLVERIRAARQLHRSASILSTQRSHGVRGRRVCAHRRAFSRRPRTGAGLTGGSCGISSQRRITGSE